MKTHQQRFQARTCYQLLNVGKRQVFQTGVHDLILLRRFPSDAIEYAPEVGQQTWGTGGNYDWRESVAKITCPLPLLFGDTDPFGIAWAEETREAFSQAPITDL
ncbi:hypothetical protein KSB_74870 [Ktedonobacter robiniae]|uniref:Uncharacterized protein n=1 Tax=Ktedonobacter robiniae TaxID=2778365 RepID=A0ABQ3V2L1_9CHLR|nr:hypothetical protein KSB_74870 [Ktedonobacter robiniae]